MLVLLHVLVLCLSKKYQQTLDISLGTCYRVIAKAKVLTVKEQWALAIELKQFVDNFWFIKLVL